MILGIDEVGRGPWAGPLVVAGVILFDASESWCEPLTDSKKLTKARRAELASIILEKAAATAFGWVSSRELDQLGMSAALRLATRRVIKNIQSEKVPFSEIIIDGPVNFLQNTALEAYVTNLKKADLLIKEVSAASIIAKVARDTYMTNLAEIYPEYGFEKHMGYGTALHQAKLEDLGPCPEHRQSFKSIARLGRAGGSTPEAEQAATGREAGAGGLDSRLDTSGEDSVSGPAKEDRILTSELGCRAEEVVAGYLEGCGHTIIARNHKTKFYEIDIISLKAGHIYFTEVKYRRDSMRGSAAEQVTKTKLKQMTFAAESFLQFQPQLRARYSPLLAVGAVSGPDFHLDDWFELTC